MLEIEMAPRVGLEPTTNRLTADCSTIELPRNTRGIFCCPCWARLGRVFGWEFTRLDTLFYVSLCAKSSDVSLRGGGNRVCVVRNLLFGWQIRDRLPLPMPAGCIKPFILYRGPPGSGALRFSLENRCYFSPPSSPVPPPVFICAS